MDEHTKNVLYKINGRVFVLNEKRHTQPLENGELVWAELELEGYCACETTGVVTIA